MRSLRRRIVRGKNQRERQSRTDLSTAPTLPVLAPLPFLLI